MFCDMENMVNEPRYQEIIQQKDRRIESLEGEPFTLKELSSKVRETLDAGTRAGNT